MNKLNTSVGSESANGDIIFGKVEERTGHLNEHQTNRWKAKVDKRNTGLPADTLYTSNQTKGRLWVTMQIHQVTK